MSNGVSRDVPSRKTSDVHHKSDSLSSSIRPSSPPVRCFETPKKEVAEKQKTTKKEKNRFFHDENNDDNAAKTMEKEKDNALTTAAVSPMTTASPSTSPPPNDKTEMMNGKLSEAEAQSMLQKIATTKGGCKRKSIIEFLEAANHFGKIHVVILCPCVNNLVPVCP